MTELVRTPDGDVVDPSDLERGRECYRCNAFVPVRKQLPPKPEEIDYAEFRVEDYAGTSRGTASKRAMGKATGVLCPSCRDDLSEFLNPKGSDDGGDA